MHDHETLLLGIVIQPQCQRVGQHRETTMQPHELQLEAAGERGAYYPFPQCDALRPVTAAIRVRTRFSSMYRVHASKMCLWLPQAGIVAPLPKRALSQFEAVAYRVTRAAEGACTNPSSDGRSGRMKKRTSMLTNTVSSRSR